MLRNIRFVLTSEVNPYFRVCLKSKCLVEMMIIQGADYNIVLFYPLLIDFRIENDNVLVITEIKPTFLI